MHDSQIKNSYVYSQQGVHVYYCGKEEFYANLYSFKEYSYMIKMHLNSPQRIKFF